MTALIFGTWRCPGHRSACLICLGNCWVDTKQNKNICKIGHAKRKPDGITKLPNFSRQGFVSTTVNITELIRAGFRFNYPSPNLSEQEFVSTTHHRTYQSRNSFQLPITELIRAGFRFNYTSANFSRQGFIYRYKCRAVFGEIYQLISDFHKGLFKGSL